MGVRENEDHFEGRSGGPRRGRKRTTVRRVDVTTGTRRGVDGGRRRRRRGVTVPPVDEGLPLHLSVSSGSRGHLGFLRGESEEI